MQVYKFYRRKEDFRGKDGLLSMYLPANGEFPKEHVQEEWEFVGPALPPESALTKEVTQNVPIYRSRPRGINPKIFYPDI
jgi:hypothetical protein